MSLVYNTWKAALASGVENWNVAQYYLTLVGAGYSAAASHVYASAFSGQELSGGVGWSAGFNGGLRQLLVTSVAVSQGSQAAALLGPLTVTWSGLSAGLAQGCVILRQSGSDALSPLVCYLDDGGFPVSTVGGIVQVSFALTGILQLT